MFTERISTKLSTFLINERIYKKKHPDFSEYWVIKIWSSKTENLYKIQNLRHNDSYSHQANKQTW